MEVTTTSVGSGEKLMRNIILDNKLELYGLYVWLRPKLFFFVLNIKLETEIEENEHIFSS